MSDEECRSSRRSSRSRAKNSSRSQALELLKQCRKDGKSHRQNVEELDDDLYEEIDEDEYIKRYGDDDFVEDDDGGGYAETGEDYFDEDDYGTKKKEKKPKAKKGAIDNYFAKVVTKPALKEEKAVAEPDEDLDAMLAQIENADGTELVAENAEELPEKSFLPSRNKFKRSPSPTFTSPKPLKIRKREVIAKPATVSVPELDLSVNDMDFDSQVPSPVRPLTPIDDVAVEPVVTETAEPINEEVTFNQFSAIQIGEIVEEDQSTTVSYGIPTDFLVDQEDGTKNLRFYWFDAFEDAKNPSRVCLFGAVKTGLNTFESCCVVVENILRRIFFIKREESEQLALYDEVKNLLTKTGVKTSLARPVKRKLAYMDGETPEVADCLEVFYDFNLPGFPAGLTHGTNFNRIGNATVTALERLLIERDIRGPCWLEISGVKEIEMNQKISHCQKEFHVSLPVEKPLLTSINVISDWQNEPLPISRLMAVNVVTVGNNKTHKPEIVLISVMRSKNYVFNKQTPVKWEKAVCFVCPPTGGTIPFQFQAEATKRNLNVEKLANENALLNRFLIELKNFDPDVIVGHDLASQFQILRDRIEEKNLAAQKWSVLGRLKRSSNLKQMPSNKQFRWSLTAGRLLLDSKAAAMELLHCQSYDLDELVHHVLAPVMPTANRRSLDDEQISKAFLDSSGKTDNLFGLIEWSFCDAHFATLILAHLNAMPLFLQITQIVGGVLSRTLMGGRAERNEYLLLHAFFKDNYIAPDKLPPKFGKKTEGKKENEDENQPTNSKKAQYTGGLVLEPKRGLYETFIVLLDFNSLYPSIIQEFNICFTTVKLQQREQANENDLPSMPDSSCPTGILPREIAKLVSSRRQVKNEMKKCPDKKSDRYKQYDIRQLGLKLTANSMYGCLGFEGSRFCAKTLAAMITFKGRQILESTKDLVESSGYTVIYGDTDSIMVNTNSTDLAAAKDIGSKIKWLINKNYKCLAMDIDGVYKRLLLLKKKKYAALSIDLNNEQKATREMKGLDIVRRDWSVLAKDVGERIVNIILESKQRDEMIEEIRETLKQVKVAIEEQKVSMEKFEILKKLTHKPEEYKDAKAQPHVQVALRLNQTRNTNYRQNDIIKYIICDDGTDQAATQRAYAKIEIESNENLKVDSHYYLAQQIHPVVARLCEPIEEMDACQVAMALGLDPTGYRRKLKDQADDFMNDENNDPGLEAEFNACDGFALECPDCGKVQIIRSVINEDGRLSFSECPSCKLDLTQNALGIEIQLMEALQAAFKKCRESVYKCDDDMCNYTQTFKPMMKNNFGDVCPKCEIGFLKKEYTWRKLYIQQKFWLKIVNLHEFLAKEATPQQKKMIENDMKFTRLSKYHDVWTKRVKDTVSQNAYSKVDLSHIFAPMEIV